MRASVKWVQFQVGRMKMFLEMVAMVAQCECTECHQPIHLKIVKHCDRYVYFIRIEKKEKTL